MTSRSIHCNRLLYKGFSYYKAESVRRLAVEQMFHRAAECGDDMDYTAFKETCLRVAVGEPVRFHHSNLQWSNPKRLTHSNLRARLLEGGVVHVITTFCFLQAYLSLICSLAGIRTSAGVL